MLLIGIVGAAGSGKNTIGEYIQTKGYSLDSFARPLKDVISAITGWDRQKLEGTTPEDREWRETIDPFWSSVLGKPITPRRLMQVIGTDVMRNHLCSNIWVESSRASLLANPKNYVITDCRFNNEVDMIKSLGGIIIKVYRGNPPEWENIANKAAKGNIVCKLIMKYYYKIHPSEYLWVAADCDHVVWNNGDLLDLYKQIDAILTQ